MTKYEQSVREIADFINEYVKTNPGEILKSGEITRLLRDNGIEPDVMFLASDYCYNRTNAGIKDFKNTIHIFEYVKRGVYQLLGEGYNYDGPVITKPSGQPYSFIVGRWTEGKLEMYSEEEWIREGNEERYIVRKTLGNKNNAFLIEDTQLKYVFVKKVLQNGDESVYRRLMEENISGLPKIYDIEVENGFLSTKEEYIEGLTLEEMCKEHELTDIQISSIALQVCKILERLHSTSPTLIHRDIKPSNIMMRNDGTIFLIDFNAVKEVKDNTTEDTQFAATPYFAAPEQAWYGRVSSNITTDIYGLGATLNYLITGTYLNRQLAFGTWGEIINKCTQMRCEDRYQNASELAMDILKAMNN